MASYQTISGAMIKIYIGGVLYPEAQSVSFMIDYGEDPIYGIDSAFPQEIRQTRVSVQGKVTGIRIKNSGGIQSRNARTLIKESLLAPYTSIQIKDRLTDEVILFVSNAKVVNESFSVGIKGTAQVSFDFKGIIPLQPNDMA